MTGQFINEDMPWQKTPEPAQCQHVIMQRNTYNQLRRQLFYMWTYMIQQDIWEEAMEFIEEHSMDPTPFDMIPTDLQFCPAPG